MGKELPWWYNFLEYTFCSFLWGITDPPLVLQNNIRLIVCISTYFIAVFDKPEGKIRYDNLF